jgi:hypothetical protein
MSTDGVSKRMCLLRAKRAAAIYIDHVSVGASERFVLVSTSSQHEAQHKECCSDEHQTGNDYDVSPQRAGGGIGEHGRFVHGKLSGHTLIE